MRFKPITSYKLAKPLTTRPHLLTCSIDEFEKNFHLLFETTMKNDEMQDYYVL